MAFRDLSHNFRIILHYFFKHTFYFPEKSFEIAVFLLLLNFQRHTSIRWCFAYFSFCAGAWQSHSLFWLWPMSLQCFEVSKSLSSICWELSVPFFKTPGRCIWDIMIIYFHSRALRQEKASAGLLQRLGLLPVCYE